MCNSSKGKPPRAAVESFVEELNLQKWAAADSSNPHIQSEIVVSLLGSCMQKPQSQKSMRNKDHRKPPE